MVGALLLNKISIFLDLKQISVVSKNEKWGPDCFSRALRTIFGDGHLSAAADTVDS